MKENKAENLVWIIFFSMGVIFIIVGIISPFLFNYENKVETTGIITSISTYRAANGDLKHNVYVSYYADGIQYESKVNSYSSSFYEGKEIDIYYDEENPNKIGMKSMDLVFFIIIPTMGLLFTLIGGTGIFFKIKGKKLEISLKEKGNKVDANYVETLINTRYSVNGRHPYNIICEWNSTKENKKYLFKSKNIWINPEKIIEENNIETFPVYIDLENKNKYIVDIDILND